MPNLHDMAFISLLPFIKGGMGTAFIRGTEHKRFSGEPNRRRPSGPDPWTLLALADQEAAAGRHTQAKCLVEAAYIAFDNQL
ncbi:MAG TPA: hypothetical protein VHO91_10500 [Rhodopila sp.]|nr:hypothetical protein [Rhodopila sp.]